jgi:hypothetical protein
VLRTGAAARVGLRTAGERQVIDLSDRPPDAGNDIGDRGRRASSPPVATVDGGAPDRDVAGAAPAQPPAEPGLRARHWTG